MEISGDDSVDLSASSTLIFFDRPVPLLRGPIPAGLPDDPSIGPFVLAFRDDRSWRSAFEASKSKIIEQCEAGARVGCSISASNKCKPLWWKALFGLTAVDFAEREQCEEREMSSCIVASKESCIQFAKDKCLPSYQDARIALVNQNKLPDIIYTNSPTGDPQSTTSVAGSTSFSHSTKFDPQATNYRGSYLLNCGIGNENSQGESCCNERLKA